MRECPSKGAWLVVLLGTTHCGLSRQARALHDTLLGPPQPHSSQRPSTPKRGASSDFKKSDSKKARLYAAFGSLLMFSARGDEHEQKLPQVWATWAPGERLLEEVLTRWASAAHRAIDLSFGLDRA